MTTLERICPNCGATIASDQARCVRCGLNLNLPARRESTLPARRPSNLPARVDAVSTAAVVLGATALIARAGLRLIASGLLPRLAKELRVRQPVSDVSRRATDDQPDVIVRGWRAWSIRQGDERSSGSEQFEWRIKRTGRHDQTGG